MGKRKRSAVNVFSKNKNFNRPTERKDYELPPRENELFVQYYKGLDIVPEGEWDDFYATLQRTLPVTFRITGCKSESQQILGNIKGTFFSELLSQKVEGNDIPPPKCLPWYPNEMGWQLDLTRKIIRSSECLSRLHDFLVAETECGALSRQEAVSMIPPLVMDIKSHHKVLDMCAAPGSKTAQLIEYLHGDCKNDELPTGFVVANDADNKRCYMMVHQVKRLQSPCFVITNHDATVFPKFRNNQNGSQGFQHFDRVLCDVPCSGDGTMRKNFDVWSKWHPLQGANMHGLQCKILRRGVQLLAKGGRLVYSTCSLNPAEDEAVISDILRSSEGALELIDIRDELPGLKYSEGLSTWKVMLKTGEWIASQSEVPINMTTQYRHTIFPPTPEEAEQFHLNRCIRLLPHQQDTGGFFVAALRKVRHLPGSKELKEEEVQAEKEKERQQAENGSSDLTAAGKDKNGAGEEPSTADQQSFKDWQKIGHEPTMKKKKFHGFKEDPFFFMEETDPIWPSLRDFYGLGEEIPPGQIMFRSQAGKRTLYFVSKAVREIVDNNIESVKFINMGVKTFSRSPSPLVPQCDFRISQECLHLLHPYVSLRRTKVTKKDAVTIIGEENPYTDKLSEGAQQDLDKLEPGSTLFMFTPSEEEPSPKCEMVFCGWRGKMSVRCFGSKVDRSHMLMLLGEDLKEMNKRNAAEKKAKESMKENNDDLPPLKEEEDDKKQEAETVDGGGAEEGAIGEASEGDAKKAKMDETVADSTKKEGDVEMTS